MSIPSLANHIAHLAADPTLVGYPVVAGLVVMVDELASQHAQIALPKVVNTELLRRLGRQQRPTALAGRSAGASCRSVSGEAGGLPALCPTPASGTLAGPIVGAARRGTVDEPGRDPLLAAANNRPPPAPQAAWTGNLNSCELAGIDNISISLSSPVLP